MTDKAISKAIEAKAPNGPAFGAHTDAEQEKSYAYFVNRQGRLLLLSKPYSSERFAESALQRFREGRFTASLCEDEQGWYLEIRTEGGKLFATSPTFASEAEASSALEEVEAGETKARPAAIQPVPEKVSAREIQPAAGQSGAPPRYSFRLDFYKAEKGAPVRGRIEYSLTQENAAFNGLDMEFVRSFVARRIQEAEAPPVHYKEGGILIIENDRPVSQGFLATTRLFEAELVLDVPGGEKYDAFVYARPLAGGQQTLIGRKRGQGGPVRLRIFPGGLPGGLYRLTATVHLELADTNYALSSQLFHLIDEPEAESVTV